MAKAVISKRKPVSKKSCIVAEDLPGVRLFSIGYLVSSAFRCTQGIGLRYIPHVSKMTTFMP